MRKNLDLLLVEFIKEKKQVTLNELRAFATKKDYTFGSLSSALTRLKVNNNLKRHTYYTIGE